MLKAWGKPLPQRAAGFWKDNLSKALSTSSLGLCSQWHVPQLLIQPKTTFGFSGASHKQIKLLWCPGRGPGERHLFSIARFCPGVCINTSSPLFCSRSLHVRVMLMLYLILPVKSFAPQELTVSSPDHLQLFRPLYQSSVLSITMGQQ